MIEIISTVLTEIANPVWLIIMVYLVHKDRIFDKWLRSLDNKIDRLIDFMIRMDNDL